MLLGAQLLHQHRKRDGKTLLSGQASHSLDLNSRDFKIILMQALQGGRAAIAPPPPPLSLSLDFNSRDVLVITMHAKN